MHEQMNDERHSGVLHERVSWRPGKSVRVQLEDSGMKWPRNDVIVSSKDKF